MPISIGMTISGSYSSTVLSQMDRGEGAENPIGIALLKKAQDQAAVEAERLIQSLPQPQGSVPTSGSAASPYGQHLDTYA